MSQLTQQEWETVRRLRENWGASDAKRDVGWQQPSAITVQQFCYGTLEQEQALELYIPKTLSAPYPVIVSIHGGGWFYGEQKQYRPYCMDLAIRGFAVFNGNYRLAPEFPYPAALEDICTMMAWIKQHAEALQLDCSRLYMVGDSAGAQLAFQYCTMASNAAYREQYTIPTCDLLPQAVGLNCGFYDVHTLPDPMFLNWYLTKPSKEPETTLLLECLQHVTSAFPPAYLACSANDPLTVCTKPLADRLAALQVPFEYHVYGAGTPEDGHVFHLNWKSENGRLCNDVQCAFFRQFPKSNLSGK